MSPTRTTPSGCFDAIAKTKIPLPLDKGIMALGPFSCPLSREGCLEHDATKLTAPSNRGRYPGLEQYPVISNQ